MGPLTPRRKFITSSVKAGLSIYIGSGTLISCASAKGAAGSVPLKFATGFKQEPLPYAYSALSDAIDAQTMEIHFTKHAATYATNLADAAKAEGVDTTKPVEEVLARISKYSAKMRNNGGGHYNHELFWKCMSPNGGGPSAALATAINSSFGSMVSFKTGFTDAGKARFGSGWVWLFLDGDKKLRIGSTPNQDNPLMDIAEIKGIPVLGLDVWEHAYYLRYQNKRPDYINNWWKVVNWKFVSDRFQSFI